MSDSILGQARRGPFEQLPDLVVPRIRARVLEALSELEWGVVELHDASGYRRLGSERNAGPRVRVAVHDHDFYAYTGLGGSVGAGHSYFLGLWDTDALVDLVRILVRNRGALASMDGGVARLGRPLYRWFHRRRANSRERARENVAAHYDLGNAFFELLLDSTLSYSSAVYPHPDADLETAQRHKMELVCRKLDLRPGDRLLEIGSGWGALAVHAAERYGARVTTTTLSPAQREVACERVRRAGLEDRVEVLRADYRELRGRYDKLVSIEMIEAVGHEYLPAYFECVERLLEPDGLALIQAITIEDQSYESYTKGIDFIRRFVFPGGCLPALSVMLEVLRERTAMRVLHVEELGEHYARTLAAWRARFESNADAIRRLGYDEAFLRLWRFYLAYCEGGFLERGIGDVQLLLERRLGRHRVPATRLPDTHA